MTDGCRILIDRTQTQEAERILLLEQTAFTHFRLFDQLDQNDGRPKERHDANPLDHQGLVSKFQLEIIH